MINTIKQLKGHYTEVEFIKAVAEKLYELVETINRHEVQIALLKGGYTDAEISKHYLNLWPQVGDTIFRLNSGGDIIEQRWTDSEKQKKCREFLGVYRTREEAEEVVKFTLDSMSQGVMR